MPKYAGELTTIDSPKGVCFEYWFGVKRGKRVYLVAPVGSLNTWQFGSVREVKQFISQN